MRRITISVLSVFVVLPAMASARLPVVNMSSGGVSARAAFGESETVNVAKNVTPQKQSTRSRRVVARKSVSAPDASVGAQIVASNDVLVPRRPSADLWAKNDTALRMPRANEFSVMRSDALLPEESLDANVARATVTDVPKTNLDAQIAKLQAQADSSMRTVSKRTISAPMSTRVESAPVIADASESNPVSLRRMVVPMTESVSDDVVVRRAAPRASEQIASVRNDMTGLNPSELRQAFRKTFLSENKHLSTFSIDDKFDTVSDMTSASEGFTARRDLSEQDSGIRPLEIKIKFRDDDSALSRANYTLLTEYAGIIMNKPTRAVQVAIPQYMTVDSDERKLAARRLAIIEQVLTDNGIAVNRIVPVLSQRNEPSFVLRMISSDQYDTLTQQKRDMFGDSVGKKTYKSMSW